MRAAFLNNQGRFEIRDLPRPIPGPDEVLIDVHACGICGSDLHFYSGGSPPPKVCPGHEICGRVALGSTAMEPGSPVVMEPLRGCGECPSCRGGSPNLCPHLQILGSRLPGGFADAVVVPIASVYRIPEDLDLDTAVLTEPLAVAVHGIGRVPLTHGDEVLVLGGGTIGLLTAFVAAQRGCTVTISVRHPHQRRLARLFGSSRIVSSTHEAILDVSQETRFDVVFETVGGKAATMDVALASVREGGSIVVLGLFNKPVTLDPVPFLAKEVRIVSSMMYSRNGRVPDFVAALEILQNERKRLSALITHHVSLEAIDDGFSLASDKRSGAIKVCVDMSQKL